MTEETITCYYCGEEKPEFYTKKVFKLTISCCKECAAKAKDEGVVNTFMNKYFGNKEDLQPAADKTTQKLQGMSEKKKAKLHKKLTKLGYTQEQITEAINQIEQGINL
jgi:SOS response regulatory protein OraA/RecX